MRILIRNQSSYSMHIATRAVAYVLEMYCAPNEGCSGKEREGNLWIEWELKDGIMVFTATNL